MEDSILNRTIYWILNHKRGLVFISIVAALFVVAVNLFMQYAIVNVEVTSTFDQRSVVTYAASGKPTRKVGQTGLMVIPRDTTSLIVAQSDYIQTESKLDIPWYGYANKKMQLRYDKNATKVAYKSTVGAQCATYNPDKDSLAYYRCTNATNLVSYKTPLNTIWSNVEIAKLYYPSDRAYPYMGGIIGLSYSDDIDEKSPGDIIAYNSNGKMITLDAPDRIADKSTLNLSNIFTNTNNPRDKRFVLVTINGDIYIGTPTSGKNVNYYRIAAPVDYDRNYNQTICSLNDTDVYCYRGKTAYGDIPTNFDFSKYTGSQVVRYSYATKTTDTIKLSRDIFAAGQFQATTSGELYTTYYKELYHLVRTNDIYTIDRVSQNADTITGGDKLYYIQNKGVFAVDHLDQTTSYKVFYSKNVIPKTLYAVAGKLYIIGSTPSDETVTYAYLLGSDDDTQPGNRAIDILPIASKDLPGSYLNDLVGQRVFVMLDLNVTTSKPTSAEIAEKKRQIVQKLSLYGSSINASNIQFAY